MKRILFILLSIAVGFLAIKLGTDYISSSCLKAELKDATANKKYAYIERMVTSFIGSDDYVLSSYDFEDGAHINVVEGLSLAPAYEMDGTKKKQVGQALKEALFISLFNFKDFKVADETDKIGGITITTTDSTLFYQYDNRNAEIQDNPNYGVNYYEYQQFNFITMPLYIDFNSEATITKIQISDGSGNVKYSYDLNLKINNEFHKLINSYQYDGKSFMAWINDYNDLMVKSYNGEEVSEQLQIVVNKINQAVGTTDKIIENQSEVVAKDIKSSPRFIIWLAVLIVVVIGVDVLIGFLIFRKKPANKGALKQIPPANHFKNQNNVIKGDVVSEKKEEE